MGVKRMETRLITEYVRQRMDNIRLQQKIHGQNPLTKREDDNIKAEQLASRIHELSNLYDILGGYNE